ncbi:MAG: PH domain-containing protein, partial [Methyloversatilis sp.]|nr:PH domain-containing protein [Methyloversatilis sp.]
ARPWRVTKPEPMLCCVPDAAHVAQVLQSAWTAAAGEAAASAALAATPLRAAGSESPQPARSLNGGTPQLAID